MVVAGVPVAVLCWRLGLHLWCYWSTSSGHCCPTWTAPRPSGCLYISRPSLFSGLGCPRFSQVVAWGQWDQGVRSVRTGECGHIGRTLSGINHSGIFLDLSPREMETKPKINKWDLVKLQSFCIAKETKQKEKTSLDWEKIFTNNVLDKELTSKI